MSPLPRFIVLKSAYSGNYLRKIPEEVSTQTELPGTFLNFTGDDMASPLAKFKVETAETDSELVHIRCCYNNKYLTRLSRNHLWIVAAAERPVEDTESFSCTMFKPVPADDFNRENHFRFVHVQTGNYACLWRAAQPYTDGVYAGYAEYDRDHCEVYKVLNWDAVFPEHVAFRRSSDGKYLSANMIGGLAYLQFTTTELTDHNVKHEIIHVDSEFVRIKSIATGLLWKRSSGSNWVLASGDPNSDPHSDPNMLFLPVQLDENGVSYRNKGNQMFCKSRSPDDKRECLIASAPDLSDIAKLELVDIPAAAP
ncbi:uncharacterized protein LOC133792683 [Humulus lupulus]|uniref:uncharacterized protein LOC133792683 n=1 Tax=Humulus lupulus TaxID=3486 RepID=UPI002B41694E|nr:uncharacterized protein LOC133792683 [Humulus lupulus]